MGIIEMAKKLVFVAVAVAAMTFGAANAEAMIVADVLFMIDTSGSMNDDIQQVKARIGQFNTAMVNNGIDAHYALVEFGGFGGTVNTNNTAMLTQDVVDFATFNDAGSRFDGLIASGGFYERGSLAVTTGLSDATFRPGSIKNLILITDEDDDSSNIEFINAHNALTAHDALFNFIGVPGVGNTNARYGFLASNHGGAAFNIGDFRADPDPFFDNFVDTKVQEIILQAEPTAAPEPVTAALGVIGLGSLGAATRRRRSA